MRRKSVGAVDKRPTIGPTVESPEAELEDQPGTIIPVVQPPRPPEFPVCGPDEELCGRHCAFLGSDDFNCGHCGFVCAVRCEAGRCVN